MVRNQYRPAMNPSSLQSRFTRLRAEIEGLTVACERPAGSVRLVAVSKRHDVDKVVALARLGQRDMAENYLQEGLEKIRAAAHQLPGEAPLCWHFIGHLQSRKCALIAEHFSWVHSIDNLKVATRLNRARTADDPLNVLIQLNLQGEASKSGVTEEQLPPLVAAVAELPNLRLRGIMVLPKAEKNPARQRTVFRRCRELRDDLNARGFNLDHLSMGMSDDMNAAITEGATMVRIGTALFGPRPTRNPG